MADINLKRKEAKTVTLTINNNVDVSTATLTFVIKESAGHSPVVTINDGSFDKTDAVNGVVSFVLSASDTNRTGSFLGELKIEFSADNIDKSADITIEIQEALTD